MKYHGLCNAMDPKQPMIDPTNMSNNFSPTAVIREKEEAKQN